MQGQKRILVADDDKFMRTQLEAILSNAGYEVSLAEDGSSAVQKAASERPDLVISDGLLPKLHGFEACKAIKATHNPPRVVVLTGIYTKPTYKWEIIKEYGADAVLNKPVNQAELLACVADQLSRTAIVQ